MVEFRSKLDGDKSRALNNMAFKKVLWLFALLSLLMIAKPTKTKTTIIFTYRKCRATL